jgi:hypothetical protein
MVLALKIAYLVYAPNFYRRKGTKPILQVTIPVGEGKIWIQVKESDSASYSVREVVKITLEIFLSPSKYHILFSIGPRVRL